MGSKGTVDDATRFHGYFNGMRDALMNWPLKTEGEYVLQFFNGRNDEGRPWWPRAIQSKWDSLKTRSQTRKIMDEFYKLSGCPIKEDRQAKGRENDKEYENHQEVYIGYHLNIAITDISKVINTNWNKHEQENHEDEEEPED